MAGKPKAPVPERRLAATRPVNQATPLAKRDGHDLPTKLQVGQAPKR